MNATQYAWVYFFLGHPVFAKKIQLIINQNFKFVIFMLFIISLPYHSPGSLRGVTLATGSGTSKSNAVGSSSLVEIINIK